MIVIGITYNKKIYGNNNFNLLCNVAICGKLKFTLLHSLVMGLPQNQGRSHKFHNPLTSPPASQGIT